MRRLAHDIITAHILAALACFWWLWFTHGACIQGAFDAFELHKQYAVTGALQRWNERRQGE